MSALSLALRRLRWWTAYKLKRGFDQAARGLVAPLFAFVRRFDRLRLSNAVAAFMRRLGPWLPEHRTGRANLAAAFPEKSAAEIEKILAGVWDNLGRVVVEFAHLDRICEGDIVRQPFVEFDAIAIARFQRLRDDGRPALIFSAHLANWELPPVIGTREGLDTMVLYRRPNMGSVADAVVTMREDLMGTMVAAGFDAPLRLAHGLEHGFHVAMLVDQHDGKGIPVTFFGRQCLVSPLIAMLLRHVDCPIHGAHVVRLPEGRFRVEITDEIAPVRDAGGQIDVPGTMQAITSVVEGWVREHPEQWLWLHRRWR